MTFRAQDGIQRAVEKTGTHLTWNTGMVATVFNKGPKPWQRGNILTMKYVESLKLGAFTNETTHRIHGTDVGGTKLPTFQDWIVQKHGHLYWHTHYDEIYEAYSTDVFREYQVNLEHTLWLTHI